jgi:hypothetical protein
MYYYVPPAFDIFEFDDELPDPGQPTRRWFNSWNGAVDEPAQDVSLGWSAGHASVVVATSGQSLDTKWARRTAGHLALGGVALPIPQRPESAGAVHQEIQRIASTEDLWSPGPVLATGGSPSQVSICDGFAIAYGHVGGEIVLVAAVGVLPSQFRVRKVMDWVPYGINATKRHPLSELNR